MNDTDTYEKPLPSCEIVSAVKLENSSGDETREGASQHVSGVQNGHARGHLLLGVEHANHVQGSRVELKIVSIANVTACGGKNGSLLELR